MATMDQPKVSTTGAFRVETGGTKSPPIPHNGSAHVISAARNGDVDALIAWVEQGGDLQQKLDNSFVSWTPLQFSCAEGDVTAVDALLEAGADPNFNEGHDSYGALHVAARYGHSEIVACLIENGASANLIDRLGHTPLHYAAIGSSVEAAKAIMEAGVDLAAHNRDGHTALDLAKVSNCFDVQHAINEKRAENAAKTDTKVALWLQTIGLEQYIDLFVLQGWDDIDFIADAGFSERDLDALGIRKVGHKRKLMSKYRINEFVTLADAPEREQSDEDDDSEDGSDSDDDSSDEDSDSD
jgi:ankyrin repeat protein|eukprot:g428.t1